jgi:hypothetical protein
VAIEKYDVIFLINWGSSSTFPLDPEKGDQSESTAKYQPAPKLRSPIRQQRIRGMDIAAADVRGFATATVAIEEQITAGAHFGMVLFHDKFSPIGMILYLLPLADVVKLDG